MIFAEPTGLKDQAPCGRLDPLKASPQARLDCPLHGPWAFMKFRGRNAYHNTPVNALFANTAAPGLAAPARVGIRCRQSSGRVPHDAAFPVTISKWTSY